MALKKISPWPFVGIGGMACLFFLYAASVLFWPLWFVLALMVVWLVLMVVAVRWFTPKPRATALVPVAGVLVYAAALAVDVLLR